MLNLTEPADQTARMQPIARVDPYARDR
jgi:hypothetical protein